MLKNCADIRPAAFLLKIKALRECVKKWYLCDEKRCYIFDIFYLPCDIIENACKTLNSYKIINFNKKLLAYRKKYVII